MRGFVDKGLNRLGEWVAFGAHLFGDIFEVSLVIPSMHLDHTGVKAAPVELASY